MFQNEHEIKDIETKSKTMQGNLREQLNTEITRKEFLQYTAGALLMVFGLQNLFNLLSGNKVIEKHIFITSSPADGRDGFGTRKFGM